MFIESWPQFLELKSSSYKIPKGYKDLTESFYTLSPYSWACSGAPDLNPRPSRVCVRSATRSADVVHSLPLTFKPSWVPPVSDPSLLHSCLLPLEVLLPIWVVSHSLPQPVSLLNKRTGDLGPKDRDDLRVQPLVD